MILTECYVENFGTLHQYKYQPQSGMNCEYALNGTGKSTFAVFLRAMFYGMPATRTKKMLDEAERKKYKPWQGGLWGGYICFRCNDHDYKLERTFGERDKDDTFRLLDQFTGMVSNDFSENIGYDLFGVDRNAFMNTIHISEPAMRVKVNDSISARLGNEQNQSEGGVHFNNAINLIDKQFKQYVKTGGRGSIAILEQELTEKEHLMWEKQKECRSVRKQMADTLQSLEQGQEKNAKNEDVQSKNGLTEEESNRLEWLDDFFSSGLPEKDEIEARKHEIQKKKALIEERKSKKTTEQKQLHQRQLFIQRSRRRAVMISGLVTFAIIVLTILLAFSGRANNQNHDIQMLALLLIGASFVASIAGALITWLFYRKFKLSRISPEMVIQEDATKELHELYEKEQQLLELDKNRMEYLFLSEKEDHIKKAQLAAKETKSAILSQNYQKRVDELTEQISKLSKDIESSRDELKKLKYTAEILQKTKECLEETKTQYSVSYMDGISRYFKKYLSMLQPQWSEIAGFNVSFDVSLTEMGIEREIDYFSSGSRDLIWFCQRMSLVESLFDKEKPFLLLDDPFVNLDDSALENTLNLVKKLSEEYQIIYMTCQKNRMVK